jgi:hypothetical protein
MEARQGYSPKNSYVCALNQPYMKKIVMLALCCCMAFAGFSQATPFVGKWKVVVVDMGFYHDFRNDSTVMGKEMKASFKDDKDSAMAVGFMNMMIEGFKDYYFVFKADGTYDEIKSEKVKQKGTYTIDAEKKLLTQISKNAVRENKMNMSYTFAGKTVTLVPIDETRKIMIVMEKQD